MPRSQISLTCSNIITSPVEVNSHRKVKLTDAKIYAITKARLNRLYHECMDIFSIHSTDTGKTDLVQMMHIPKDIFTPLNQKSYTLPLKYYAWIRKEVIDLEKAGILSPV